MKPITAPGAPAHQVLDRFAAHAEPVGLAELDAEAALRTRVDVKYLVDAVDLHKVLAALASRARVLQIDGRRAFGYRSVYFDTPCLATYRAHVQQRRRRYKIRTRCYLDSGEAMLEVKYKGHRGRTVKRRRSHDPARATELTSDGRRFVEAELHAAYRLQRLPELGAAVSTDYHRTTFAVLEAGERVTCDVGLQGGHAGRVAALDPRLALIESKSADGHGHVDRLLRAQGVRPVRISKQAVMVASTREDLPGNPWHPVLQRMVTTPPHRVPASPAPPAVRAPETSDTSDILVGA